MTQDMAGLKNKNAEKDQSRARPGLNDFSPHKDNLCFQQIECEEGTVAGGKAAVKLFGVTEASLQNLPLLPFADDYYSLGTLSCSMSLTSYTTFMLLLQMVSILTIARNLRSS